MGCVFGIIGSDGRTQNSNNRNASDGGVGAPGDEVKITQPPPAEGPNRTESVSEYYSCRTLGNSFATNQQGWPSWLVAVAGDAIKDWTPRRADTFQKIDKVIINALYMYHCFSAMYYVLMGYKVIMCVLNCIAIMNALIQSKECTIFRA